MKANLEFDLPEDENDLILATNGKLFALVCWNMEQQLRNYLKYGNDFKTVDHTLETIREDLHSYLDKYNINLDMIK